METYYPFTIDHSRYLINFRPEYGFLKKLIPILLLFVFFLYHGGRILLYLECRFSNSITTASCDCARILADTKPAGPADVIPVNNHANHKHLPEEFESNTANLSHTIAATHTKAQHGNIIFIATGFMSEVFHPPGA